MSKCCIKHVPGIGKWQASEKTQPAGLQNGLASAMRLRKVTHTAWHLSSLEMLTISNSGSTIPSRIWEATSFLKRHAHFLVTSSHPVHSSPQTVHCICLAPVWPNPTLGIAIFTPHYPLNEKSNGTDLEKLILRVFWDLYYHALTLIPKLWYKNSSWGLER